MVILKSNWCPNLERTHVVLRLKDHCLDHLIFACHLLPCLLFKSLSQALRLNRICSEAHFFDKRCNELESWLRNRGYSDKMVRNQILRARKFKRINRLNKQNSNSKEDLLVFNTNNHPTLFFLKNIHLDIHLLLTPDKEHQIVFQNLPIMGFRWGKSLKDSLVRAKIPSVKTQVRILCTL